MTFEQVTIGPCTLYRGDAVRIVPTVGAFDVMVTDPPYGISYESGKTGYKGGTALGGIVGDEDTSLRDAVLAMTVGTPSLVFGSWKRPRPIGCAAILIWEKGDHVGMGDLSIPWKPNTEEIYVIGRGFSGHRGSSVLRYNAPVSWNSVSFGRTHPHEKPLALMMELVSKCDGEMICDPFMGSGTTALACIQTERQFIGIEIDGNHFETACRRIERAWQDKRSELPFDEPEPLRQRELLEA